MRWFYFRNPRGRFSPSPKLRKIKYGFALILVVFLNFPTFSEPHDEIPKKRRAWDSNPRATSAVQRSYGRSVPYHSTTAALAGLRGSTSRWCAAGRLDSPSFFDENWWVLIFFSMKMNYKKIDTPVCKLKFSRQIWFFITFHENQWFSAGWPGRSAVFSFNY